MKRTVVGANMDSISYYSRFRGFSNMFLGGQGVLPAKGVPLTADTTVLVFDNNSGSMADVGVYKFSCTGNCQLTTPGTPAVVQNWNYDPTANVTTADVVMDAAAIQNLPQLVVGMVIPKDANGNAIAPFVVDPVLFRPGADPNSRYFLPYFQPLKPFSSLRFMGAINTIYADEMVPTGSWSERAQPTDNNYGWHGLCYEDCVGMSQLTGAIPWLNIYHNATDDFIHNYVALIFKIAPTNMTINEFGNECWNYMFEDYTDTFNTAQKDTTLDYDGNTDPNIRHYRWLAKRVVLIAKTAMAAWGVDSVTKMPFKPVLAGQDGNPEVLRYQLDYVKTQVAGPAGKNVSDFIYGCAIAPYAGISDAVEAEIQAGTITVDQLVQGYSDAIDYWLGSQGGLQQNIAYMQAFDSALHPLAYEIGFDCGQDNIALDIKNQAAADPRMRALAKKLMTNWANLGGHLGNYFMACSTWNRWGQWGATENLLADLQMPKLLGAQDAAAALFWDDGSTPTTFSLFSTGPDAAHQAVGDPQIAAAGGVELGVQLTFAQPGKLKGIRFWQNAHDTGGHTVSLWILGGHKLLGQVTVPGSTQTGWQEVDFAKPVAVQTKQVYVVSYHTTSAQIPYTPQSFQHGLTVGPITVRPGAGIKGNGMYAYSNHPVYPALSNSQSPNYWVDVVFVEAPALITGRRLSLQQQVHLP